MLPLRVGVANSSLCTFNVPSSGHTGVLTVALGDGSVHTVNSGISAFTFTLAMLPNDSTPLPSD
jgi:hypothetical protein